MHVFLIAAESMDGFIAPAGAGTDDASALSTSWTSIEDKKRFVELTKRAGVVIMGSKTFETFGRALKDRRNIIYSRDSAFGQKYSGIERTNEDPAILLARLEKEGHKEVAICGGSHIYTLFMKAGLVDTLYLTIEPIVFGDGVPLFSESIDLKEKLTLVSSEKTEHNTLLLEYRVA